MKHVGHLVLLIGICLGLAGPVSADGNPVTLDLNIRAVINTVERGPIDALWHRGGQDTTGSGDRVIWGYFYADPGQVSWGSADNPELFVKIWFSASGRLDINYFHVSAPDIDVFSDYPCDGNWDEQSTLTTSRRYVRHWFGNSESRSEENYEDGYPVENTAASGSPTGISTINRVKIAAVIHTVDAGGIDGIWRPGGSGMTSRGDRVAWGYFYADPNDVSWGSGNNPELFVKIWLDVAGRLDVNFFHVSVPDISVFSDLTGDGMFDQKERALMTNRYIRHEYQNVAVQPDISVNGSFNTALAGAYDPLLYANDLAVYGQYAYVAGKNGLTVLDISDKADPVIVGKYYTPDCEDVWVEPPYAYLACGWRGFQVVDVSNPSSPKRVGSFDSGNAWACAMGCFIDGKTAFVANGQDLLILDISTPAAPVFKGVYPTPGNAEGVYVTGSRAYVADGSGGMLILDVSDLTSPFRVAVYSRVSQARDVVVSGGTAYLADHDAGVQMINVSDPSAPVQIGIYTDVAYAAGLSLNGSSLAVADIGSRLTVLDVSSPENPLAAAFVDVDGKPYGVCSDGRYIYAALWTDGLAIVDMADPDSPAAVGAYRNQDEFSGFDLMGQTACIATYGDGLRLIDLSAVSPVRESGAYAVPALGRDAAVYHSLALFGGSELGFEGVGILDLSDPALPVELARIAAPESGSVNDIFISHPYAYIAFGSSGLHIYDISRPDAPVLCGTYSDPAGGHAAGVVVIGGTAYMTDGVRLLIINVSDPSAPALVAAYTAHSCDGIFVADGHAFLGDAGTLIVLDVTDPSRPVPKGTLDNIDCSDIRVEQNTAYIAGYDGLSIVDVSDPAAPVLTGAYRDAENATAVRKSGDALYVSFYMGGLHIIECRP